MTNSTKRVAIIFLFMAQVVIFITKTITITITNSLGDNYLADSEIRRKK